MLRRVTRLLPRVSALVAFRRQFEEFRRASDAAGRALPVRWADRYPCLDDASGSTEFDRHYVYHEAWAMRVLREALPVRHVDVGSSLHFVAQLSAFVPVVHVDVRPPRLELDGLEVRAGTLMALPFEDASQPSLSCLHVLEHVGLGRYGDPLDPEADRRAAAELRRVLAPGGELFVAVPVGRPRVCFNAHRVYDFEEVVSWFGGLELVELALVPDWGDARGLIRHADPTLVSRQVHGCGCFRLRRPQA